jgi:antitoxin HicB
MPDLRYRVLLEPEEEGGFHAFIPALPGVHTHGATEEEALAHVREAAEAYVEDMLAQGEEPPVERLHEAEITVTA